MEQKPAHGTILIVDDEMPIAAFLADLLTEEGYSVRTARDGVEALAEIWRQVPQLVILDLMMPRMSGEALLIHLRANGFRDLPVIIMSAGGNLTTMLAQGATAVIPKPMHIGDLLATVSMHIAHPPAHHDDSQQSEHGS